MDKNSIIEAVMNSAVDYYEYLEKSGKGKIISEVAGIVGISYKKKKGKSVYRLNLLRKLKNLENVYLEIDGIKCPESEVELVLWDEDKKDLVVAVSQSGRTAEFGNLEELKLSRITVVSDMKYLVERVGQWFSKKSLFLPVEGCVKFSETSVKIATVCSKEQEEAVKFALTHPFSYVWGAPGTGKTKFVLANCVVNYLLRNEKVIVLAPTNNAAEQALSAVIDLSDELGISRSEILRLGTPSKEFADKYPEVCAEAGLSYLIKTRKEKEEFLKGILEHKRHINEFIKLRKRAEDEIDRIIWELDNPIIVEMPVDFSLIDKINTDLHLYVSMDKRDVKATLERFRTALDYYERELKADGSVYSAYDDDDESEIAEKLADMENRTDEVKRRNKQKRMGKAKVICATIDTFIHEFSDEDGESASKHIGAAHIFLDEAGYSSIAKAMTLFSELQPVTFFGDHFQLPPVCEMDDDTILRQYGSVCLWAQSALYIGDMFCEELDAVVGKYFYGGSPSFFAMPKVDLSTTYRFGQNMLDVLSKKVYGKRLESIAGKDNLEIEFIDAPKVTAPDKKRENPDEVSAIRMWLKANGFSKRNASQSAAILTPYKNQVFVLKRMCFPYVGDEVYSIHGSQGREWDTVILSVCDTSDMFFVDSESIKSKGKLILNTAISRAKKRLVIVCDYAFWIRQDKQLITELLLLAQDGMHGGVKN